MLGVVIGKFLPPHRGHSYLIETACAGAATSLAWAHRTVALLRARFGRGPDVAFTSEEYGPRYARFMGARHVSVDPGRIRYPVSGTAVRADPWRYAELLAPAVRAWYLTRVCVLGAESTGTTTLVEDLVRHYGCRRVPEYGRAYCVERLAEAPSISWRSADFTHIAERQLADEDAAARDAAESGQRMLICDTDALATSIWHERYLGVPSAAVTGLAAARRYALYVLTADDIPFVQDGTRDGEAIRGWMTARFREALSVRQEPWIEVRGTRAARLATATERIDTLLAIPVGAERSA